MKEYTIYCTEEQTKKALELGAPIPFVTRYSSIGIENAINGRNKDEYTLIDNFQQSGDYWCKVITNPTAEQMISWLEEQEIFIHIDYDFSDNEKPYKSEMCLFNGLTCHKGYFLSRKEATLAAIDAALENLSNKK